jgi:hypothetical protein
MRDGSSSPKHEFQTGTLVNVSNSPGSTVNGTQYNWVYFAVRVDDLVYVARGDRLGHVRGGLLAYAVSGSGYNGNDLIVGDPIQVRIDGDSLFFQRPNGKEVKTKIVKRQREKSPTPQTDGSR